MLLEYDGTNFDGWQRQGNTDNTIQGRLEEILSRLLEQPVAVIGSGRTDAGVHAHGQVANWKADTALSPERLQAMLRANLPESIGLRALEEVPLRFHSRLSAREKTYRYRIWTSDAPCVFERRYLWLLRKPLDIAAMRDAASHLLGRHDFRAFCSNRQMKKSTVRELRALSVEQYGDEIRLTATGDGFLYNMVRILAGTLVEVGLGRRAPEEMEAILQSRDRAQAGATAPAKGLLLWEVLY